jgi:hypothetical protein
MTTNPETSGPAEIPFDGPCPVMTNRATLDTWHAAVTIAAAHANPDRPQLAGITFRPADPNDTDARFTMTSTDSYTLARVTVTSYAEGWPNVAAVLPAREFAAAVAAAVKTHGKRDARDVIGTLTVSPAGPWTFTTDQHRNVSSSSSGHTCETEQPNTDALAATIHEPSAGATPYEPTGWALDVLGATLTTAKKAGAELIHWHQWNGPLKPSAITYTTGHTTAHVLLMPTRIR